MNFKITTKTWLTLLFLSNLTISLATSKVNSDTTNRSNPLYRPLPFLNLQKILEEPTFVKTLKDGDKDIKYIENDASVDCIFYNITSDKNNYQIGETVKIKIKAQFYDNLNLSYRDEECQKITLKVVLPKGFVQQGGNYYDFIALSFDRNNNSQELEIIGHFTEFNDNASFVLLKGPKTSNWETIFVKKGEKYILVNEDRIQSKKEEIIGKEKLNIGQEIAKEFEANSVTAICPAAIVTSRSICAPGGVVQLPATCPSGTVQWFNTASGGTAISTTLPFSPIVTATRTYYVKCNVAGCSPQNRTPVTVTVINPSITKLPNTTLCAGSSVTLTATPTGTGFSYAWTGANLSSNNISAPTATPTSTGNYSVVVSKDGIGCTISTSVIVNPKPTATITTPAPYSVCSGLNISLSGTGSGGTGTLSYRWTAPTAFTSATTSITRTGATTAMAGVYTFTVTASSCTSTSTINVGVLAITAIPGVTVCSGKTATLTAAGCTGIVNWYETNSSADPILSNSSTFISPALTSTRQYFANCTSSGCTNPAKTAVTVTVNANPSTPTISPTTTNICKGSPFTLTGVGTGASYLWSGPLITNTTFGASKLYSVTAAQSIETRGGIYTFSVRGTNGCISTATTNVTINTNPTSAIATSNSPVCIGSTINFTATGGSIYSWTGPSSFSSSLQSPTRSNASSIFAGIYTVTVRNPICTGTVTATTNVTFSPPPQSHSMAILQFALVKLLQFRLMEEQLIHGQGLMVSVQLVGR